MEKAFSDLPSQHCGNCREYGDLAALESMRQSRKPNRPRWLSYLLVALCTVFAVFGTMKAYNCFAHTNTPSLSQPAVSLDISISKAPKEDGFALGIYNTSKTCGGKPVIVRKGTVAPKCFRTTKKFQSVRMFNGLPSNNWSLCMYTSSNCKTGTSINSRPVKGCSQYNSTTIKSFSFKYGLGLCPSKVATDDEIDEMDVEEEEVASDFD